MALAVACGASYPLEGSRRGAVEDVGGPWGLFQAPKSWGTNPSIPLGPARDGGTARGGREQNEVGKPVRAYALKASPKGPRPPEGGRVMAAAVAWWRAGVQCGHEGHAQSPRVCVRAWGWPLCLLPQTGKEQLSRGAREARGGISLSLPRLQRRAEKRCSGRDGRRATAQGVAGSRGRVGKPALFNDEAARQVLREVLEELGCGSRAVGQLQLLQLLQLHEAR
jgi:hypothetical protein